jgi:hypothetical protein
LLRPCLSRLWTWGWGDVSCACQLGKKYLARRTTGKKIANRQVAKLLFSISTVLKAPVSTIVLRHLLTKKSRYIFSKSTQHKAFDIGH